MGTQVNQLKKGDILSETQYYIVQEVRGSIVEVKNERGFKFGIDKNIVEEGIQSASQFTEERKVSKTELAEMLLNLGDSVFEVSFQKQPTKESITAAINSVNKGSIASNTKIKEVITDAYEGENRILRGYKIGNEAHFGRIKVIDLEVDKSKGSNIRLIDLRNINYLIHKNVKYTVK